MSVPTVPLDANTGAAHELGEGPEMRPVGGCEAALRACINGGGDPTACWNAYWRCTG